MNSSPNSLSCDYQLKDFGFLEQRQNFLSSDTSAAVISVTIVNLLVSPLIISLNTFVMLADKTTPQLRNKYKPERFCWPVWQELAL